MDLFSGIGGISLALREWVRPIAYCEIDPYARGVLLSRMADGDLRPAPIWDDITSLDGSEFISEIDVVYAGFPCQDLSIAGLGKGLEGERSGLFYEIIRLAREIEPRFIFLENVPAITSRGGTEVVRELAALGYDCRWCIIPASAIGAIHVRERWFLLAYAKHDGLEKRRCDIGKIKEKPRPSSQVKHGVWNQGEEDSSPFLGEDDVVSYRVDRVKALGNSVVPAQCKEAFKILMGLK